MKITVCKNKFSVAWPGEPKRWDLIAGADAGNVMRHRFKDDAHFTQYAPITIGGRVRRFRREAFQDDARRDELLAATDGRGVEMAIVAFDVDRHGRDDVDAWWLGELLKLDQLHSEAPGFFAYRTTGGYRIVYRLAEPRFIKDVDDELAWREWYTGACIELERFEIAADHIGDWTRLFRCPRVERRDGKPSLKNPETIGDAGALGVFELGISRDAAARAAEEVSPKKGSASSSAARIWRTPYAGPPLDADGAIFRELQRRGLVRHDRRASKGFVDIECPSAAEHSGGDGSAIYYPPGPGQGIGFVKCLHAGCGHDRYDVRDWCRVLNIDLTPRDDGEGRLMVAAPPDGAGGGAKKAERFRYRGAAFKPVVKRNKHGERVSAAVPPDEFNLAVLMANHPGWQGATRLNLLTQQLEISRVPDDLQTMAVKELPRDGHDVGTFRLLEVEPGIPCGRDLSEYTRSGIEPGPLRLDSHLGPIASYCQELFGSRPRDAAIATALRDVSASFHPVRDYLRSLTWDGTSRVETPFIELMGAEDCPLVRAYTRKWLIGGVARAMDPGCKLDTMLILRGKQGLRKSAAMRELCHDPSWFSDTVIDLGSKDSYQQVASVWLYEFSELDAVNGKEVERVKAFMSAQVDRFRPPYGRDVQPFPRQLFCGGTVNGDAYLRDDENRRFWSIDVHKRAEAGAVAKLRDQIWAEAYALWKAGEHWWLEDAGLEAEARREQSSRVVKDAWALMLKEPLDRQYQKNVAAGIPGLTGLNVLELAFRSEASGAPEPSRAKPSDTQRAARVLKQLGYERQRWMQRGPHRKKWFYVRVAGDDVMLQGQQAWNYDVDPEDDGRDPDGN